MIEYARRPEMFQRGNGAGDRIRTGDIDLGKVALYQLSYSRASDTSIVALPACECVKAACDCSSLPSRRTLRQLAFTE